MEHDQAAGKDVDMQASSPPTMTLGANKKLRTSDHNRNNANQRALGRKKAKKVVTCGHADKPHYGKGLCANCYHLAYYHRRRAEIAAAGLGAVPASEARKSKNYTAVQGRKMAAKADKPRQTTSSEPQANEEEKKQRWAKVYGCNTFKAIHYVFKRHYFKDS